MRHFSSAVPPLAAVLLLVHACSNTEAITPDVCGNLVIEAGAEDCDRLDKDGMRCRQPGTEGQCRFDCVDDSECTGVFRCGSDSICRAPSGELALEPVEISDDAWILEPRDFDGDGYVDLLSGTGDGSALSYMAGLDEDDTQDLPHPLGELPVTTGQLTEDSTSDLVYAIREVGIAVERGSDGRQLLATAHPGFTIPVSPAIVFFGDADETVIGPEVYTLFNEEDSAVVVMISLDSVLAAPSVLLVNLGALPPVEESAEPMLEAVPSGKLSNLPCEQYVLAYRGLDRVFVGTACREDGDVNGFPLEPAERPPAPLIPLIEVDLTACDIAIDRAFLIDVDADEVLDVLLSARAGGDLCVVRGPLTFAQGELPGLPALAESDDLFELGIDERMLAVEHLNGDGVPDFVTTRGAFASHDGACELGSYEHRTVPDGIGYCSQEEPGAYRAAAIGDINGNGVLDVALARQEGERVTVLSGYADGTFTEYTVETEGCVPRLALGDVDGDGLDDLLFADRRCEQPEPGAETSDLLGVAYGRVSGGPEDSRSVGSPGIVEQLVSGKLRLPSGFDALEDVALVARDLLDQNLGVSVLPGSANRQLQAPFTLIIEGQALEDAVHDPTALSTGKFADFVAGDPGDAGGYVPRQSDSARDDLAVVGVLPESGEARLWLVASRGDAELAASGAWPSAAIFPAAQASWADHDPNHARIAASNLDETSAADELVYVSGRGLLSAEVISSTLDWAGGSVASHPVFSVTTAIDLGDLLLTHATNPGLLRTPLVIANLDADAGGQDIIVVGQNTDQQATELLVLWNEGGTFTLDRQTRIALDDPAFQGKAVHAFLPFNFDQDEQLEIVVGHAHGAVLYELDGRELAFGRVLQKLDEPVLALAAADFDRDGVQDLVLGSDVSTLIFRSLPSRE